MCGRNFDESGGVHTAGADEGGVRGEEDLFLLAELDDGGDGAEGVEFELVADGTVFAVCEEFLEVFDSAEARVLLEPPIDCCMQRAE